MSSSEQLTDEDMEKFDWVQLYSDMEKVAYTETRTERLYRKIMENPFVPIGCLATATALTVGLWSFRHGKKKMSQYMMRTRIVAQGFTVFALIVGMSLGASKLTDKPKPSALKDL